MSEFVTDSSEQEPSLGEQIAAKLRVLGEEHGFDEETCDEIAKLPFEEAFEMAYGYLVQAGIDPDEILADFKQPNNSV